MPVCEPALNAKFGLSASLASTVPETLGCVSSTTVPEPVPITGASSVPVKLTVTVVVLPSFKETVYTSVCCSPPAKPCAPGPAVNVQLPSASTTSSPYVPVIDSATNARSGLSPSMAVNVPVATGSVSSVTFATSELITGASSVPVIVISMEVVLPSLSATVNVSTCTSPSAKAWLFALA